jgi:hypothetical protein
MVMVLKKVGLSWQLTGASLFAKLKLSDKLAVISLLSAAGSN